MKDTQELRRDGLVAIVGAGPGGAMLARLLQMQGFDVRVFERDGSPTARPQGGSLDLRPDSGQRAIDAAELTEPFARSSREEAKAFRMIDGAGNQRPGMGEETHEDAGPEIDRGDLRRLLLDALAPDTVAWDHTVEDVHPEADGRWRLEIEGEAPVFADLVVGADGIGSKVRRRLTNAAPRYTGITMVAANIRKDLWRGSRIDEVLGEGSVMFAAGGKTIFVQRCAHDLILLYYSLAVPEGWPKSAGFDLTDKATMLATIRATYADWSPDVLAMLTEVEDAFQLWPTSVMPPDYPWTTQPGLTMLGDASHVMPPFTGKGVNLALLDALELADGLSADAPSDVTAIIDAFEKRMHARTGNEIRACLDVGAQMYGIEMDFSDQAQASAVIDGERLAGRLLGAAGDWMLVGPDGFLRMDVRLQVRTGDGAVICAHYFGPAEANERMRRAMETSKPTRFADQRSRTHWLMETGDPRYDWVNRTVFVGEGRFQPGADGAAGFEHRVYPVD